MIGILSGMISTNEWRRGERLPPVPGGDDRAAFSAGINVTLVRVIAYTIGGLFAGVAGMSLTALVQSADPTLGPQYTLVAIAAVALGGTSLAGQTCNVAVIIDTSKYLRRVLDFDPRAGRATVEPGCVPDTLNAMAREHRLTLACVPATHRWNTVGGMVGNNSCGVRSLTGGKTDDNVEGLDGLTYDGTRMRLGATGDAAYDRRRPGGGRAGGHPPALRARRGPLL